MTDRAVIERTDVDPGGSSDGGGRGGGRASGAARGARADDRWRPQPGPFVRSLCSRAVNAPLRSWVTFVVVAGSVGFAFLNVHPELVLRNTTPTGGDMGAHVWGPNYLMHNLLPNGRLSGWTPDWYAGFPAFQFYMVLPSLMVVALDVGVRNVLVVPAVALALAVLLSGFTVPALRRWRWVLLALGAVIGLLAVPVPYNIAFKLVTISGLLALPVAAWAFGRLSDLPFPGPPLLALGALYVLYNREPVLNGGTGNIIGGNMASTMAGEFAFSISLVFGLLYLGFLVRGLRTGRHRGTAAVLLALTGLSHLIPAFFALGMTLLALAIWPGRKRLRWALPMLPVAGLLSAFWVVPFLLRHQYVNDMGWEKLPTAGSTAADGSPQNVWDYLVPRALWWPLAFAAVGAVVSIVYRYRAGLLLAAGAVSSALAFLWIPQTRLWNARVLPFFYLSLFLLAAVGVAEVIRSVATLLARDPERPGPAVGTVGAAGSLAFTLVFLGIPLGQLPGSTYPANGGVTWAGIHRDYRNDVPGWAEWNYSGLEGKSPVVGTGAKAPDGQGGWPEYRALVATMASLGQDPSRGCGRAFWEYGERIETYGTPMAPMLLPYFTKGCIGSMEGLYFESSTTTPYHFLTQCELSEKGSCAQRDLAYRPFDHDLGIRQLALLGVKYYLAFSPTALAAAEADDTLTPVAVSGPWRVYQLPAAASALVTPLDYQPVVMRNVNDTQGQWLDPSVAWFLDPSRWAVPLASSGPKEWARVTIPRLGGKKADGLKRSIGDRSLPQVPKKAVKPATVSNISTDDDSITFEVDRVGSPVLVKASYFPNWQASGAKGPYRVTPNLMVVIPTSTRVSLRYGRTSVDYLGILLTLVGLAGLVLIARAPRVTMPAPRERVASFGRRGGDDDPPQRTPSDELQRWLASLPPPPTPATPGPPEAGSGETPGPVAWGPPDATGPATDARPADPPYPPEG